MRFWLLAIIKHIIIFLTKLMTGRVIEDVKIDDKGKQKPKKPAISTEHKIEFPAGYTASVNSIITFCILILVGYTTFFFLDFRPKYIQIILNYNLLTVATTFILLYVLDSLMPRIATKVVERIVECQWELAWREWRKLSAEK